MTVLSISLLPSMSGWLTNSCSAVAVALRIEAVDLVQPVVRGALSPLWLGGWWGVDADCPRSWRPGTSPGTRPSSCPPTT